MLPNAAVGSVNNITPNREKAASNDAGWKGNTWASAWTNCTRPQPAAARLANAGTAADTSTPTVRRDVPGKLQRRRAAATADVQHTLTGSGGKPLQSPPTERAKLQFQELPDLCPGAHPHFVLVQ